MSDLYEIINVPDPVLKETAQAVNKVDAIHARAKGLNRTVYLGEHAFGNHAFLLEGIHLVNG